MKICGAIRLKFFVFLDLLKHLFVAFLLSITTLTVGIKGDCVMYDVCNTNGFTDQNCPYDGPPIALNDAEAEEILLRRCTDFFHDGKIVSNTIGKDFFSLKYFSKHASLLHTEPGSDDGEFHSDGGRNLRAMPNMPEKHDERNLRTGVRPGAGQIRENPRRALQQHLPEELRAPRRVPDRRAAHNRRLRELQASRASLEWPSGDGARLRNGGGQVYARSVVFLHGRSRRQPAGAVQNRVRQLNRRSQPIHVGHEKVRGSLRWVVRLLVC